MPIQESPSCFRQIIFYADKQVLPFTQEYRGIYAAEKRGNCVFSNYRLQLGLLPLPIQTQFVLVKNGESLSLVCIDYYSYYNKELGEAIKRDNPVIKMST